jgi:hypothetical protein
VHIDLPGVHPQEVDEVGPWVFLDEASNPSVVAPGAVLVGGDPSEPRRHHQKVVVGAGHVGWPTRVLTSGR